MCRTKGVKNADRGRDAPSEGRRPGSVATKDSESGVCLVVSGTPDGAWTLPSCTLSDVSHKSRKTVCLYENYSERKSERRSR